MSASLDRLRIHYGRERDLCRILALKPQELGIADIIALRNAFAPFASVDRDVTTRLWALGDTTETIGACRIDVLRAALYGDAEGTKS